MPFDCRFIAGQLLVLTKYIERIVYSQTDRNSNIKSEMFESTECVSFIISTSYETHQKVKNKINEKGIRSLFWIGFWIGFRIDKSIIHTVEAGVSPGDIYTKMAKLSHAIDRAIQTSTYILAVPLRQNGETYCSSFLPSAHFSASKVRLNLNRITKIDETVCHVNFDEISGGTS